MTTPNTTRIREILRRPRLRQKMFGVDHTATPGHYAEALAAIMPAEGELRPADMTGEIFDVELEADRIHAERVARETWNDDLLADFHAAIDNALADFGAAVDAALAKFDAHAAEITYRTYVAADDTAEHDMSALRAQLVLGAS